MAKRTKEDKLFFKGSLLATLCILLLGILIGMGIMYVVTVFCK